MRILLSSLAVLFMSTSLASAQNIEHIVEEYPQPKIIEDAAVDGISDVADPIFGSGESEINGLSGELKQEAAAVGPLAVYRTCAVENGKCYIPYATNVRYGVPRTWHTINNVQYEISCNNATFGDPIPGLSKGCQYEVRPGTPWRYCAAEGGVCQFQGVRLVSYGVEGAYTRWQFFADGVQCNNGRFGDPATGKRKFCRVR